MDGFRTAAAGRGELKCLICTTVKADQSERPVDGPVKRTFLLEADLNGNKVLKEHIVDVGAVHVEELLQL